MAIRKSSSSGTPFGDTSGRPSNASVGQTYYNGTLGYLEIYTSSGWIAATGANDFSLNLSGPNTSITFSQSYSSGSYSIVSASNDLTLDIYAYKSDGTVVGYTNTKSFTASDRFNKMVILGGVTGDVLSFSYKTTYATTTSTTDVTAGPYISSITPSSMPNIGDSITVTGGNFATNATVTFVGTGYSSTSAKNVVRNSSTQLVVTRPDNFPTSGSPYTITVTNPSVDNQPIGSSVNSYSPVTAGSVPIWATSSLNSIYNGIAFSQTLSATDADGSSVVSYTTYSGTLPSGVSLNGSTGVLSGTPSGSVGSSISFTIRATDSGGNYTDKSFSGTIAFYQVSSMVGWFDASDGTKIVNSAGSVTSWTNKVNSVAATQSNSSYQPSYISNGQNSLPVARYSGSKWLSMNTDLSPKYIIAAMKPSSGSWQVESTDISFTGAASSTVSYKKLGGANVKFARYGNASSFSNASAGQYTTTATDSNTTDWLSPMTDKLSSNSFTFVTSNTITNDPYGGYDKKTAIVTVGGAAQVGGYTRETPLFPSEGVTITMAGGSHFNGDIAELFLFNAVPSGSDITFYTNYLKSKWSIA